MTETTSPAGQINLIGGDLALDFCNTIGDRRDPEHAHDYLGNYADVVAWAQHTNLLSSPVTQSLLSNAHANPRDAESAWRRALDLRDTLYRIFSALAVQQTATEADVTQLGEFIADAYSRLAVRPHKTHFEWTWTDQTSADWMLDPIVRAAAELLTSEQLARVRQCSGDDCSWLFIDTSKNHSRRWCDMNDCGNRAKARRHYARVRPNK